MYEKELKRILDASQNNALSFFVGAGVSALSGAPTWKELIHAMCDELGQDKKKEYSSDECLQIPQMYYYSLGENKAEYYKFIETQLHISDLVPNKIHREMLNLNPVSFVTTNYDTLLENAATQYCQSFKVVSKDEDVPTIFGDRFVLKLHGDFKNNNIVLKEEDYLNYSENFKLIETLVKSIFSTNTVVFIGYGLNDYNIKLILNWVKSLLKDNFRKPIFIYTGNDILSHEELLYHKSKGLSVIEWNKLVSFDDGYMCRYKAVFEALRNLSKSSLDGKTENDAFEILYRLLEPLDRLNALRIEDVSKRLYPYANIGKQGVIHYSEEDSLILKKFFDISQMEEDQRNNLPKDTLGKYQCVLSVFKKARIFEIENEYRCTSFITEEIPFADKNCILFDYKEMVKYSAKNYLCQQKNYKKAFYLARLKRYDESFFLFSKIAKTAFEEKDYLTYYFAESNCISLRTVINNANTWFRCFDITVVDALSPSDSEIENLFRYLPVEFRNTYDNLKDIHSVNLLYKYSYEAFIDGQKLQKAIESGTAEFGMTSSEKAIYRINDYLHFLIGNGIIADIFTEYKSTVKNLMSLLVYKYSQQDKKSLQTKLFPFIGEDRIQFDEIDFYCLIECFNDKEIRTLINKYHIETVEFQNMDLIEFAVNNIIDYYDYAKKISKDHIDLIRLQSQIKNCISLLRYVNISQRLFERICDFILTHEFRDILINDKVLFLDFQLAKRNVNSDSTSRLIENTLISYIDHHISALKKNENFEVFSTLSGINYCNLVHYISPFDNNYISRRLSIRVSRILSNKLVQLYPHIIYHYCDYVSKYQRGKLVAWANEQIANSFNFDYFTLLIRCNAQITSLAKKKLKEYLKDTIKIERNKTNPDGVMVDPAEHPYDKLEQVGYWCLIKRLKANDYKEFLGISAKFDFYCQYTRFDFSRFEVSWLFNHRPYGLEQISKNKTVKDKVRAAIVSEINNEALLESDEIKLKKILTDYFC